MEHGAGWTMRVKWLSRGPPTVVFWRCSFCQPLGPYFNALVVLVDSDPRIFVPQDRGPPGFPGVFSAYCLQLKSTRRSVRRVRCGTVSVYKTCQCT